MKFYFGLSNCPFQEIPKISSSCLKEILATCQSNLIKFSFAVLVKFLIRREWIENRING